MQHQACLHKLDVVQVVLSAAKVEEAEGYEERIQGCCSQQYSTASAGAGQEIGPFGTQQQQLEVAAAISVSLTVVCLGWDALAHIAATVFPGCCGLSACHGVSGRMI